MLCAANKNRTLAAWTIRLGRSPCPSDRPYGFTLGSAFPGLKNKRREREREREPHYLLIAFYVLKSFFFLCREKKKIICLLMGCQICFANLLKGYRCPYGEVFSSESMRSLFAGQFTAAPLEKLISPFAKWKAGPRPAVNDARGEGGPAPAPRTY